MKELDWDSPWDVTHKFSLNGLDARQLGLNNVSSVFITANYDGRFST